MPKRLISILQYAVFLGLGIFFIWWQFKDMTPEESAEFRNSFAKANYWLILPVILMSLLSHLSRSVRWKILMEPMGYKPSLKNTFSVTMVGYLANSAVPRLGEILKCTLLGRYEKIPAEKLIGTILLERTFDLICYAVFIAITVLIQIDVVGVFVQNEFGEIASSKGLPVWAVLLISVASIVVVIYLFRLLFKKFPGNKIIRKIIGFAKGMREGFLTIRHLKNKGWFIAHTIFIWTMYLLQIYIGFYAMGKTSHLGIGAACSVLSLATLAMIITPGGIGAFPVAVQKVLVLYNVQSKSFGWLIWGVSTCIIVVVGFICLLLLPIINRNKKHISNETGKPDPVKNIHVTRTD
jgi:hypothetical protein